MGSCIYFCVILFFFISIYLFAYVSILYLFFLSFSTTLALPVHGSPWGFAAPASRPAPTEEQGKLPALLPPQFLCLSFPIRWGVAISPSRERGYFRLCFEVSQEQLRGGIINININSPAQAGAPGRGDVKQP